jgi:PadR family transcriptional regulator, regulatory protein PadR
MRDPNPNFMNGVPELLILRLLRERPMYGYELAQAIRERSDETIAFGEGVIYPVLHALERDGALSSERRSVNGRFRVYYAITAAGSHRLADLAGTWTKLSTAIRHMLIGDKHAEAV